MRGSSAMVRCAAAMASRGSPTSASEARPELVGVGRQGREGEGLGHACGGRHRVGLVEVHDGEGEVRLGELGRDAHRLLGDGARGGVGDAAVGLADLPREGGGVAGHDERVLGRVLVGLLEELDRAEVRRGPELEVLVPPLQIELDCPRVGHDRGGARGLADRERVGHRPRDLVPDAEHVLALSVEALGPYLEAVLDREHARAHANLVARRSHASVDDDLDVELAPLLARVAALVFEAHHEPARANAEAGRHRQAVDEIVGEPVDEVVVLGRPAAVAEGKDGDRNLVPSALEVDGDATAGAGAPVASVPRCAGDQSASRACSRCRARSAAGPRAFAPCSAARATRSTRAGPAGAPAGRAGAA